MYKKTSSTTAKLDARRKMQISLEKLPERPSLDSIKKAENFKNLSEKILTNNFEK